MPNVQHSNNPHSSSEAASHDRSKAVNESTNTSRDASSGQIPQLSINGGLLSSQHSVSRQPRSPVTEIDSAWGANFWVTLIEPQSQTPFYACPATGQVSWDPPVGNFVLPPSAEGEWWELIDESRGLPYYYHTKTNETVWERPTGFVIPLAILQNTALCRRLSVRYSQILDPETVKSHIDQQITSSGDRQSVRRSISDQSVTDRANRRRSASATRGSPGSSPTTANKSSPQTPRRSTSNDQYRQNNYGFNHTYLPPIPASPYQTEESTPPSPKSRTSARIKEIREEDSEKGKESQFQSQRENEKDRAKIQSESPVTPDRPSANGPRSIPIAASPHFKTPPQSLTAAAELFAYETTPPRKDKDSSPTPQTPVTPISDIHGDSNMSFFPQAMSSPVRSAPQTLKVDVNMNGGSRKSISLLPTPTSPISPGSSVSQDDPSFLSLSKGKGIEKLYGNLGLPPALRNIGSSPAENKHKTIPPPPLPAPRKSFSANRQPTIRTEDISTPKLDNQATMDMSPVKARSEGKPILVDVKNSLDDTEPRNSTGGRPIIPEELASEIQQFTQTEFARQYFSTHKTGFIFKKKVPVEKMMSWQKNPLSSPLLTLNRNLHKEAVKTFKVIQRVMGDRERDRPVVRSQTSDSHLSTATQSVTSLNGSQTSLPSMMSGILEEQRWLLTVGLMHGELRDEIYCQVVKQLSNNPGRESIFRGWQLLCVLVVTFPPSKNFEPTLRSFIQQNKGQTEGRVDIMAKYCYQRLSIIAKKGPRGKAPTVAEIETASDAAFNPSTFGESLDAILRLQERTYPHLQIPIILPFLADGILALGGTKSEGIFRIPGDGDSVSELKIKIERGYYNLEGIEDPHVPASLLKLWLRELLDPLVPNELYNDCVACAKDPDACVQMVSRLPTYNRRVVLFVISFLQLFLDERVQAATKMTSANLALVMAPNLLRCESESMTVVFTNAPYEQMFVHNLLLHLKCNKIDPGYVPKHGLGSASQPASVGRKTKRSGR